PNIRRDVKVGRANSTQCRAGRSGDQDNPLVPSHCRMRPIDRDLIRGGHSGQRSCEPHLKAEHMAAPTNAAYVKKALANSEPSAHGTKRTNRPPLSLSALGVERIWPGQSGPGAVAIATIKSVPLGKAEGCRWKGQCVHLFAFLDWLWRG